MFDTLLNELDHLFCSHSEICQINCALPAISGFSFGYLLGLRRYSSQTQVFQELNIDLLNVIHIGESESNMSRYIKYAEIRLWSFFVR